MYRPIETETDETPSRFHPTPDGVPAPSAGLAAARHQPRVTLDDLPPADTTRWVVRRKATVVHAVQDQVISLEAVCARYGLSIEEFESWERLINRDGVAALRSTRLQDYRDASRRQRASRR